MTLNVHFQAMYEFAAYFFDLQVLLSMIDTHCKRLRERHLLRELRLHLIGRNNGMKVHTYNQPTLLPVLLMQRK